MPEDFRHARREAAVAAAIWAAAALWTLAVSYTLGAERPVRFVAGLPAWIAWGVVAPWLAAFAAHVWYSLRFVGRGRED